MEILFDMFDFQANFDGIHLGCRVPSSLDSVLETYCVYSQLDLQKSVATNSFMLQILQTDKQWLHSNAPEITVKIMGGE